MAIASFDGAYKRFVVGEQRLCIHGYRTSLGNYLNDGRAIMGTTTLKGGAMIVYPKNHDS